MTRFGVASTALVLLVVASTPVAVAQGLDVPALVPDRTVFHLELRPGAIKERGGLLAVAKIFDEPEVKQFLDPLLALLDEQMGMADGQLEEATGLGLSDLALLWDARLTVTALDREIDGNGQVQSEGVMGTIVTLDFGPRGAKILDSLTALEGLLSQAIGVEFADRKLGGRTVRFAETGHEDLVWVVHETTLIVTSTEASMERMLQAIAGRDTGPRLANVADFKKVRKRVVRGGSVLWLYLDVPRLIGIFSLGWNDEVRDLMMFWGLNAYGGVGYGVDLDGDSVRDRIYLNIRDREGWAEAWRSGGKTIRSPSLVPAETTLYSAGLLDFGAAFRVLMRTLDDGYEREAREVRAVLDQLSAHMGIDIQRDLIGALGPEYAFYMAFPRRALIPDIGLAFEIKESARPKFRGMIDNVRASLTEGEVKIQSFEYRGHRIHYLDLLGTARGGAFALSGPHTLKPSFAIVDDFLVVTLWPQSLKNLIVGFESKAPRLADRPDFVKLRKRVKLPGAEASLFYVDLQAAAGFVLDNVVPLVQSLLPAPEEVPIDIAQFPTSKAVTKHLFGVLGVGTWDEDGGGGYSELVSPIGALPSYVVTVGAIAGATVPFLMGSSESFSATVPQEAANPATRARRDLAALELHVQTFEAWEDRLPRSSEWPGFLTKGSENHPDPFLAKVPTDPWGRPYVYELKDDGTFRILTLGKDGKPGGTGENADLATDDVR